MEKELLGGGEPSPTTQESVSPWAKTAEFKVEKDITPTSVRYLTGNETSARPEWRDEKGGVYHMTFIDHNHGSAERKYENKFQGFMDDMARCGVKKGMRFKVKLSQVNGKWSWNFVPHNG